MISRPLKLFISFLIFYIFIYYLISQNKLKPYPSSPKGYALLVASPEVDNNYYKKYYNATFSKEPSTEEDLHIMQTLLEGHNFHSISLISKPKVKDLTNKLKYLNTKLKPGDTFVFFYSGHGYQTRDSKPFEEPDSMDENLVLYDGLFVDDSVSHFYLNYFKNSKNIMIINACRAGTMPKILSFYQPQYGQCNISFDTFFNDSIKVLYIGASTDTTDAFTNSEGSYITLAMSYLHSGLPHWNNWTSLVPDSLICKISKKMQDFGDPSNGLIQYSKYGNLDTSLLNNYLFKL